jgi:hypothetical protein
MANEFKVERYSPARGTWGLQIVDSAGVRVPNTRAYGDSKRSEAEDLCALLNATYMRGLMDATCNPDEGF